MSFVFRNFASSLKSAWSWQDTSYLQQKRIISIICKNVAKYLFFAWLLRYFFYLIESCKKSYCQIYSKIYFFCQNLRKYLILARTLQDDSYWQEKRKLSIICKNVARYLSFALIFKVFVIWKNLATYLLIANI